jgi:muramoyltetrapeptide carboxypeptidase LdcA involved in peptidoglycan recycling
LTTVINAIFAKTGKTAVLYQIRNLIYKDSEIQIRNFTNTFIKNQNDLFSFQYEFIQGDRMRGIIVGGNIRCLLKLAGTLYWPDMKDKILFLESYGGTVPQMVTFLNHLKQIGVFDKINGILLGTFTQMEKENSKPSIVELVIECVETSIPIAVTNEIGHSVNSKAIVIGQELYLDNHTAN